MVVLKVSFLLSKNLIDPSVVKVSPYYFLYGKYLFFLCRFILFLHLFCNRKEIYGVKTK